MFISMNHFLNYQYSIFSLTAKICTVQPSKRCIRTGNYFFSDHVTILSRLSCYKKFHNYFEILCILKKQYV